MRVCYILIDILLYSREELENAWKFTLKCITSRFWVYDVFYSGLVFLDEWVLKFELCPLALTLNRKRLSALQGICPSGGHRGGSLPRWAGEATSAGREVALEFWGSFESFFEVFLPTRPIPVFGIHSPSLQCLPWNRRRPAQQECHLCGGCHSEGTVSALWPQNMKASYRTHLDALGHLCGSWAGDSNT